MDEIVLVVMGVDGLSATLVGVVTFVGVGSALTVEGAFREVFPVSEVAIVEG